MRAWLVRLTALAAGMSDLVAAGVLLASAAAPAGPTVPAPAPRPCDEPKHYIEVEVFGKPAEEGKVAEKPAAIPAAALPELIPLNITLPKPSFSRTPGYFKPSPHLERWEINKPRPAFMVPRGTTNVALGKPVTASDMDPIVGEINYVTDGNKELGDGNYVELPPGVQWVQIDLKGEFNLYAILVWHYRDDGEGRVYHGVIVQVADDPDFTKNVRTLYNNDYNNSAKLGCGEDPEYVEDYRGRLIDAKGVRARYVRLYSRGNTFNDQNHYVEVEVFGKPVEGAAAEKGEAEAVDVRKIWDAAPHNAFTDLVRHGDRWLCVFREGTGHVSHDGKIRVIASADGTAWASAALVETPDATLPDLRDPKICHTPDGRLMLVAGAANRQPSAKRHRTYVWFSSDGRAWGDASPVGDENFWLWRVTWQAGQAYAVGYGRTETDRVARLYRGDDGRTFTPLVPRLFETGYPNEATLRFLPNGRGLCLLRRDGEPNSAQLLTADPPYETWTAKDLGVRVGGPNFIRLPDGRCVAATRRYDGGVRTSLHWLDPREGTLAEFLRLPSDGDTSYAGLVWHEDLLWVSYYSSHEGKTSIYLARVRLAAKE